jgi:hypothetical protein
MSLGGEHFTIGLWFDQPIFPSALLAVGDVLVAGGGRYDGEVTVGPSGAAFTYWGDLRGCRSLDRRVVEGTMAGTVEGTVYSLSLHLPVLGRAHAHFAWTPTAVPAHEHPVEIDMAADLLWSDIDALDRKDRKQAKARERAFLRRMKALCAALDPAYARMGVETGLDTPTPAELASGTELLGPSAYVSHRLAARPGTDGPLEKLAQLSKTLDWDTGTHYEWGPVRGERQLTALRAANRAVSTAVGRALAAR